VGDLWTRRPTSSGLHRTERKGAKMNLEGDLLRTEEDPLLQDCTRPLRDPERPCRDSSFPAVFTHEGVFGVLTRLDRCVYRVQQQLEWEC
jgi:hypothetical protein